MKIIEWCINTGIAGCDYKGELFFDDDVTDGEIDEAVKKEVFNTISWDWTVVEEVVKPRRKNNE